MEFEDALISLLEASKVKGFGERLCIIDQIVIRCVRCDWMFVLTSGPNALKLYKEHACVDKER